MNCSSAVVERSSTSVDARLVPKSRAGALMVLVFAEANGRRGVVGGDERECQSASVPTDVMENQEVVMKAAVADEGEMRPIPAGMRYEHGKVVPHLTLEARVARGKAARREVPRSSHAGFTPGEYRPDPVALLEQQAVSRVQDLVPIRYGRMLVSPFTFYRGAALLMASDLAATPRSGITTQV